MPVNFCQWQSCPFAVNKYLHQTFLERNLQHIIEGMHISLLFELFLSIQITIKIKRITACTLKDITCIVHFLHPIIDTNHKKLPQAVCPRYPLMWTICIIDPWLLFCNWFMWQGSISYTCMTIWTLGTNFGVIQTKIQNCFLKMTH